MKFEAVIFDLDGTLVDSLEDLADAMNLVLRHAGFPEHPIDAYRAFIGDGIDLLVRRALPKAQRSPEKAGPFVRAMKTEYARRWTRKTRPYPGIDDLLAGCAAAGVKMAVLTNKPEGPALEMIARLLPRTPFASICGARPDLPAKPDPTGALDTACKLGVAPDRCLLVGDMAVDMQTAVSAGMYPVGALWGFRSAEALFTAGARLVAGAPRDLIPWLGG